MRRVARFGAVVGLVFGAGLGGVLPSESSGQPVDPPPLPGPAAVPADLNPIARRMDERVRRLEEDVTTDLGNAPQSQRLIAEIRELEQSVGEFRDTLGNRADQFQARQAYAGIDATLHNLMADLARPDSTSPAVARSAQRVAESDTELHRALGMNDYPPGYYGGAQPLTGTAEAQRLAHALVDRAEMLASTVRADMVGAGGGRVVQDAVNLAQQADIYHDSIDLNGQIDAAVQNGFSGVAGIADRLEEDFRRTPPTPRVQAAWQSYRSTEVLMRQAVGLQVDAQDLPGTVLAVPAQGGGSPVLPLADQLVQQSTEFVQVFSQTAGAVPEGRQFLADSQALVAAATGFRKDVGRNLNPGQLAYEFREVDAVWQRLARRTNRIARGRTGPNIQQVGKMGLTVSEIHRLLGIPGYAPVVNIVP